MQSRRAHLLGLGGLATSLPLSRAAAAVASRSVRPAASVLGPLKQAMAQGRFVTYHPTAISLWYGKAARASDDSILADLKTLRPWFDGIITYSASNGAERVPEIAARLGFRAVILGVWNPVDDRELANAVSTWKRHPRLVAGLSLGNEIVLSRRGTWGDLAYALTRVRAAAPGLALSTSEPFAQFLDDPEAHSTLAAMDFMMVNVHPIFESWFHGARPANWADFVVRIADRLSAKFPGPVLIKETGVPSGPRESGFTDAMQRAFYREMAARMSPSRLRAFAYFSAFDLPWHAFDAGPTGGGIHPEEAHWGFFTERRAPKPIMADLAPLALKRA